MRSCSELIKKALKNSLMTAQKVVRPGAETKHVYAVRARSEGDCYTKDMLTLCVCCMLSGLLARELRLYPSILCAFHTHFNSDKGLILGNPAAFLGCTLIIKLSPRSCFITAISGPNHGGKHLWAAGCEIGHVVFQLTFGRVKTSHRK